MTIYIKYKILFISISKLLLFDNKINCFFSSLFLDKDFVTKRKIFQSKKNNNYFSLLKKSQTNPEKNKKNELMRFTSSGCNGTQMKLNLSKVTLSNV
jgi:hypothetical protein